MSKNTHMKTSDLPKSGKKTQGWLPIALIGAPQAVLGFLIVFIVAGLSLQTDQYGSMPSPAFHPIVKALARTDLPYDLLITTILSGFILSKLKYPHAYKTAALANIILFFAKPLTGLLTVLARFESFRYVEIILLSHVMLLAILSALCFLIAYSVTKTYGKIK